MFNHIGSSVRNLHLASKTETQHVITKLWH